MKQMLVHKQNTFIVERAADIILANVLLFKTEHNERLSEAFDRVFPAVVLDSVLGSSMCFIEQLHTDTGLISYWL